MGAVYAIALFAGVLVTAFFPGDAESRLFKAGPNLTRGRHALRLLAGVLTLPLLRSLSGVWSCLGACCSVWARWLSRRIVRTRASPRLRPDDARSVGGCQPFRRLAAEAVSVRVSSRMLFSFSTDSICSSA